MSLDRTLKADSLLRKLEYKPMCLYLDWLEDRLFAEFNYSCVDSLADFNHLQEKAVTKEGLIKARGGKHEKDDRPEIRGKEHYVLGWDNKEKIAVLQAEVRQLQQEEKMTAAKVRKLEEDIKNAQKKRETYLTLFSKYDKFDDIDWQSCVLVIQQKQEQKRQLEEANNRVKILQEQLAGVRKEIGLLDDENNEAIKKKTLSENRENKLKERRNESNSALAQIGVVDTDTFESQHTDLLNVALEDLNGKRDTLQHEIDLALQKQRETKSRKNSDLKNLIYRFKNPAEEITMKYHDWRSDVSRLPEAVEFMGEYQAYYQRLLDEEEGYSLVLCFALSGYSLSANVMETLVKKGMKIEEIKKAASGLKVSDRLFCYSTLIRNTQESVWVRERLEGEYKSFNGYDLEHAVRLLISIGSMDALDYLVTRPEMIKYRDDYHFNYDNPNAISSLCYFIRYCYEHKIDGHFMLNSILNSLERIAIKSKDVLMEVTQYLRQLTQRGEMYKYLNRYIIGFEDKYYAAYSGISDINEAMRIADGGRLTKTEEEKAEEIPWREDEGIYISYNWEGHSAHIVDYLGFVLENRGIPFKLDKKDCPYTVNIKEFMNAIRAGKTVIVVLSRPYLRSKNCMYELSGIMENVNYKDRMLPVVVDDTIRDDDFYVELVKH